MLILDIKNKKNFDYVKLSRGNAKGVIYDRGLKVFEDFTRGKLFGGMNNTNHKYKEFLQISRLNLQGNFLDQGMLNKDIEENSMQKGLIKELSKQLYPLSLLKEENSKLRFIVENGLKKDLVKDRLTSQNRRLTSFWRCFSGVIRMMRKKNGEP